ncbi:hypothetical protein COW36_02325 [bacterium (Candidatus Blackallbacteria) CG17_big_fil_post_rev_8_21_14_2_50_48_46]|uniref:FecR protein domain-containing protein n=1 Tax=bacterium (Candidatus Blackallbacteria) CG17_big_fil_post_rev_8_21_14_2_50_48_46 TaxID=2014261 RepID=A0A2M7G9Z9_9BACT|nr:MAG: hypothetical protein COW64_13145 [bacterium (Candidatus Blackallbacteria) CG18_big_fil_WC_8_21_14_2_50_49_26]PIW18965.1 MAG: hypothetical protein COW36_02325 [bacterium (Candidatus Blackallbacteria) CG17_big_fil_post_rev_8_21_14_2_50_48_46]PIW44667.1 MAG: hypothetical protein COW20_23790 [bacterium (Candidatus Blackallbacteria) CG13_big_fil_rev_8_21_14_2_50_49_14]
MMKRILPLSLTAVVLVLASPHESQADSAARVAWTHNTVQINRGGHWISASRGMPLSSGTYIRTGGNSRAQIHYADGSVVRLGSRSIARIRAAAAKQVQLHKGKAYFKVQKQNQKMRVRTRTAVATVLGTEFMVSVEEKPTTQSTFLPMPDRSSMNTAQPLGFGTFPVALALPDIITQITVFEGNVGVSGPDLQNMVNLGAGMMTLVGQGLPPAPPQPVDLNNLRQQEPVAQDPPENNGQTGNGFSNSPVSPDNPQQQVQINQNSPGQNINTTPATGELEVVIK